ncbi:MAG TPA: GNAT family N-acetyltransferase [Gemmatimonadaceae bacterium]|nr:GNAT family N-acetyltransferase [Gemmatimonadaceae bacterium]
MKAKCFGCATVVEAADSDAVVHAFLAHARDEHAWSYPEEALRNYARNCAEAAERLTGATERLSEIDSVTVHPVTAERVDDWLGFFDHDGFADNADWASCYCLEPHVPATPDLPERPWRDTRSTMARRLSDGMTFGYLAYVDGRPAGWVNASLRSEYGLYQINDAGGPEPRSVIGVSCFVVAPPFRRHGVASTLLDRVIVDASARGAAWIEGYPHNEPESSDAGHFRGPRSMYEARGFQAVERRDRYTVMRRPAD